MIYVLFVVTFPLGKIWWWAMYDQNKFCWCIADFYLSVCAFAGCSTYAHTIGFFRSWVDESIQKDLKPDLVSFHMEVVQKTCSLPKRIIKVAKWPVWNIACIYFLGREYSSFILYNFDGCFFLYMSDYDELTCISELLSDWHHVFFVFPTLWLGGGLNTSFCDFHPAP